MLYNVNLETGDCVEEIEIGYDNMDLTIFIQEVQAAAVGLENPKVGVSCEDNYGDRMHSFTVSGHRKMTDAEIEAELRRRDLAERQRRHMARMPKA